MQISSLIKECDQFLNNYLNDNPSSELIEIIYDHCTSVSVDTIISRMKENFQLIFTECVEKYVFLRLKFDTLCEILKLREFTTDNEYYIIRGVISWVLYDLENRIIHAKKLFPNINCTKCRKSLMLDNEEIDTGNLQLDYTIQQLNLKISIINDSTSLKLINLYKIGNLNISFDDYYNDSNRKLTLCRIQKDSIFSIKHNTKILAYSFGSVNRIIYIRDYLYTINFIDGKMYKYNTLSNDVFECSYPCNYEFTLGYHPMVTSTVNGFMLNGGRYNNTNSLNVCIYNMSTNTWINSKSSPYNIYRHATISDGDDIYVIGGFIDNKNATNKVIRFRNNEWTTMSPLLSNRVNHTAILYNKCIYVYGGDTEMTPECYDISTDKWSSNDTNVFNGITYSNSVYDECNRLFYMSVSKQIYSISIDDAIKTLVYDDNDASDYILTLLSI